MTTLLYCYKIRVGKWYLTSWNEEGPCDNSNPVEGDVYFRAGFDKLFNDPPTFFSTREEAVVAAEAMGFTVLR
jgi:hypothetical protein